MSPRSSLLFPRSYKGAQGLAEDALEQRARANMRWEQAALGSDAPSVEAALTEIAVQTPPP